MARRRARAQAAGKKIYPVIRELVTPVTFISSIISKDTADLTAAPTVFDKAKVLSNIVTGRMTGFNIFGGTTPQYGATQNPGAIMTNPWVKAGAGLFAYGIIGGFVRKRFGIPLPETGRAKGLASRMILGGAVGAYFDAPDDGMIQNAQGATADGRPMNVMRPGNVYNTQSYMNQYPVNPVSSVPRQQNTMMAAPANMLRGINASG